MPKIVDIFILAIIQTKHLPLLRHIMYIPSMFIPRKCNNFYILQEAKIIACNKLCDSYEVDVLAKTEKSF